jgi:hypothetical protein
MSIRKPSVARQCHGDALSPRADDDAGLQQITLDDVGTIAFADAQLQTGWRRLWRRLLPLQADKTRRLMLQSRGTGAPGAGRLCRRGAAVEGDLSAQPARGCAGR